VGTVSLTSNTGSNNVALGYGIGSYNTSGSFNTYIGTSAGFNHKFGSNNIFLGNTAGTGVVNASNKLYIETTGNTTPLIGGDFSSRQVHLNGNVGIGTTTPGTPSTPIIATAGVTRLHVTGGKTILDQEAWQTPATQGSWVQTGGETIGYYMDSTGRVWLRGIMNGGTCSGNMLLLPAGYRPKVRVILSVGTNWGTPARLIIQTSGYVWCWVTPNPSAEIELNSLNFATH
jgi:hypothetical protein